MAYKMIVALMALATATSAFTIPGDQNAGVYIYSSATDAHTKVADTLQLSARHNFQPLKGRRDGFPASRLGCTEGTVTALDYASAVNALSRTCSTGPKIPRGNHAYAISGGAVAFMCNYGGDNPCSTTELSLALGLVSQECATYQGGWALSQAWAKSYGFDTSVGTICGNE